MTYQELEKACREDTATFRMAFILLCGCGAQNIGALTARALQGNMMTELYKERLVNLAKGMSETPSEVVLAVIQRALPPIWGDGNEIPHLHIFGDEEDICPVCGSEIEYDGDNQIDDDGTIVSWTCPGCGATGKSGYTSVFDGHYLVHDGDGNEIPERKES